MENLGQILTDNFFVVGVLVVIVQLIILLIGYFIIDSVCEYRLEHPFITFIMLFFFGLVGFFVELLRNSAVDNAKRIVDSQIQDF
ncbi:prenylated Rab acceptor [Lactococcus kimchii]|uniref:prenylated Rab acceptor n=1 Tax=Lactococcus sp. S-13 TaxID=2507158 RepID=UPI001023246D|nr:prenylated Rab acceptor [Lactococcus sp. S-13]RZI49409.1 prenylated Rab acceptor [Lactococcus sp. S-13]